MSMSSDIDVNQTKIILRELITEIDNDNELKNLLSNLFCKVTSKSTVRKKQEPVNITINPIAIVSSEGENVLLGKLNDLEIPELIAIIKKYGFDKTRKSYKWKTKEKIVKLIKDKVCSSSKRGDVFSGKSKG